MERFKETVTYLKGRNISNPEIGIILGSGLGKLVNEINIKTSIEYQDIPYFPVSTVEFHSGELIFGKMNGKRILVMHGRFHFYEGYTLQEITFPIRVMKLLGVKYLMISNACGSINPEIKKGSLMLLDDHINLLPCNPLIGKNYDELGPRFPDMSQPYSKFLNDKLIKIAEQQGIDLYKGIYVAVTGPNLETRAEYRFLRRIGADVVGMSTIPEVIVANHMDLPCIAISVVTDECDPDNLKKVDIEDIIKVAGRAELKLTVLFSELIKEL
ncbi:MAG: purine-nucleoside phosphorylase [Bacteroidetes bacterium]|nr:purine-nucleoside phosphorylase [Bacteroidota bacterium]